MNAKPKTELNRCVFVQKRNSVNGALVLIVHTTLYLPFEIDNCLKQGSLIKGQPCCHCCCIMGRPRDNDMSIPIEASPVLFDYRLIKEIHPWIRERWPLTLLID